MSPDSDPNNAALQAQLSLKVSARGYEGEEYLISFTCFEQDDIYSERVRSYIKMIILFASV